jgi:hypothetical protein
LTRRTDFRNYPPFRGYPASSLEEASVVLEREYDVNGPLVSPAPTVRPSFTEAVYHPKEEPPPGLSLLDVHDPTASPAPSVDPPSSGFDIGGLGKIVQHTEPLAGVGEGFEWDSPVAFSEDRRRRFSTAKAVTGVACIFAPPKLSACPAQAVVIPPAYAAPAATLAAEKEAFDPKLVKVDWR